jgi:hypothetical protein
MTALVLKAKWLCFVVGPLVAVVVIGVGIWVSRTTGTS